MEGRPERIVDYFVVVGLPSNNITPFKIELVDEIGEGSLKLAPPTNLNPITDVALISKKNENIPKGFKCIETTVGGYNASLSNPGIFGTPIYLCYRQGGDKPPITEISIYNAENSKHFPDGHETIAVTVDGRSGDLSGGGRYPIYLTVKRGFAHGYNSSTAITKLSVIIDGKDDPPLGYKSLPITLSRGRMSPGVRIYYKTNLIAPSSLAYTAEINSRYPMSDNAEFSLPESVPLFCLPFGVSVEAWNRRTPFPLPTFSTFALTNANGRCMYGACVVFYEQVPKISVFKDMQRQLNVGEDNPLYMSKCICLLSHWPFFAAFRDFLSSLYRLSISQNNSLPLERYIANLFTDVPFPTPRRPRVQMQIGPESIVFSLPIRTPLPMGVTTHWTLLSCLDVDHCITLLHLALLEQKIVLHSYRPALLTSIGEAIRSILFPLQWQCTYIPMCPLAFASYLQAPVPFIIGMDSRYFESYSAPPEVCVLDLDGNTLTIGSYAKQQISTNPLPQKAVRLLRKNLLILANEVSSMSFGNDFAVEVAPINFEDSLKLQQERIDVTVREIFLRFIASLLTNYRSCLRPLMSKPSFRYQDISDLFDLQMFFKQKHSSEKQFYKSFSDTQTFTSFIEQRSFAHAESTTLAFFDECTEKMSSDSNAKLLNIDEIVSRRYDLPTVVTPPPDESGLIKGKRYSYQCFPRLDPTLFHSPLKLSQISPSANNNRKEAPALINMAVRTQAEKTKSKTLTDRAAGSDALWSKILLSQTCCMWYMLLSHHIRSQWNKLEVLSQGLELLEALRTKQALPSDEVCYRALMEQCVQLGKPALAVRVYSAIQKAGIHPNAVTYGFYNKALMDKEWPSVKRRWKVLKIVFYACFYLRHLERQSKTCGRKSSIVSIEEREANFQFIRRSNSHSSDLSITALDIGVEGKEEPSLMNLERRPSLGRISRGSVYRLNPTPSSTSSNRISIGDYAFRDDSFYIADKCPLLNEDLRQSGLRFLQPVRNPSKGSLESSSSDRQLEGASVEVCVCSSIQCPNCKSLLYDEEIMACWSEEVDEYNITCPYCYKSLVPSLTVKIKKLLPNTDAKTTPTSPVTVATSIEDVIQEESSDFTNTSSSTSLDPSAPLSVAPDRPSISLDPSKIGTLTLPDPSPQETLKLSDKNGNLLTASSNSDPVYRKTGSLGRLTGTSPLGMEETNDNAHTKLKDINKTKSLCNSEEEESKYKTLPLPNQSRSIEQTDSGIREYVAMLKKRGHKRTVSAPVPSSPPVNVRTSERDWVFEERMDDNGRSSNVPNNLSNVSISYDIIDQEPFIVPYLSPLVLRKELESLLTQGRSLILSSESFTIEKPILYWNLVWYFTRLRLPTYLPLLLLRKIVKDHPHLKKPGVRMQVETIWDNKFQGVNDPLYMIWSGAASGTVTSPYMDSRRLARRNSSLLLQPLVARIQCGDLSFVLRNILNDRKEQENNEVMESVVSVPLIQRSAYRQLLFLKLSLYPETFDIDLFDKEYQLCLQRLPKESAVLLQSWDYPPSAKACHCRKEFGLLKVF